MSQEAAKSASPAAPAAGALVYVAAAAALPAGAAVEASPYALAVRLRQAGVATDFDLSAPSRGVGNHLKRASKLGARLAVIIGEDELQAGEVTLKDMAGGEQRRVKVAEVVAEVKKALG